MHPLAFSILSLVTITGCGVDPNGSRTQSTAPNELVVKLRDAEQRMHDRFGAAQRLEEAIARSDLDRAHTEARLIGTLDEPDVLPTWRPYFDAVAAAAAGVEATGDVASAAHQAANLGLTCARCHGAAHAKIAFPVERRPPDDPKTGPGMASHHWAAIQMWNGLIGPSEDRWLAGAQALTTVPLTMVAQAVTPTSQVDVDDVARVRVLARRALAEPGLDSRAEIFGSLLSTCAHCHALLRDR